MVCGASATFVPEVSEVSDVLRQSRYLPSSAETVTGRSEKFEAYMVPVRAFSGRPPPLAGDEKRGSRQVPVHSGELVSTFWFDHVSLYDVSVRYAVDVPAIEL